jgi:hypothetical protein
VWKVLGVPVGASGITEGIIGGLLVTAFATALAFIVGWLRIRFSGKVEIEFGPAGLASQWAMALTGHTERMKMRSGANGRSISSYLHIRNRRF